MEYIKIRLADLATSPHDYVEVKGIARAAQEVTYPGIGNARVYTALLQSSTSRTFIYISGDSHNIDDLSDALCLLKASSETGIHVIIRGQNAKIKQPHINQITEIKFNNLTYRKHPAPKRFPGAHPATTYPPQNVQSAQD